MTEKQGGSDVRSNTTTATARGDGELRAARAQVVLQRADVRRLPLPRPGARGHHVLPRPADPARRHAQPVPDRAPQGQARQPLERELGGRARRDRGLAGRRAGPRRPDDHRDGRPHPAGLRHRLGRRRCAGARRTPRGTRRTAAPSAGCWPSSRSCATCSPTSRSSPRPRPRWRCASRAPTTRTTSPLRRLGTAVGKYWVCKRAPAHAAEAMECLGGNGYVEESGMPRLFRESPLNSIWEGSGNVNALDVLRALARQPAILEAWFAEVGLAAGADARLDAFVADAAGGPAPTPRSSRRAPGALVERLALALQGSLLVRHAPPAVADAFCASRLAGDAGHGVRDAAGGHRRRGDRRAPHADPRDEHLESRPHHVRPRLIRPPRAGPRDRHHRELHVVLRPVPHDLGPERRLPGHARRPVLGRGLRHGRGRRPAVLRLADPPRARARRSSPAATGSRSPASSCGSSAGWRR